MIITVCLKVVYVKQYILESNRSCTWMLICSTGFAYSTHFLLKKFDMMYIYIYVYGEQNIIMLGPRVGYYK